MKSSKSRILFQVFNVTIVSVITASCLIPIINLFAYSLSSPNAILANKVFLWPVEFNLKAYEYVMGNANFWSSVFVSLKRVLLGVPINLLFIVLAAYPLSKSKKVFPARKYYIAFFLTAMLFNGGLMPTYFIVSKTGLIDSIWSLILPGAVQIFSVIVLMNFFRGLPGELEESARLDGANQFQILVKIYLPLSKPSLATVTLFSLIEHWNSWFDGLIYSNYTTNYPLQSYLQTLVVSTTNLDFSDVDAMASMMVNDTNMKAAQIFISVIPLMLIYPFLQHYFATGLTLGSVKG